MSTFLLSYFSTFTIGKSEIILRTTTIPAGQKTCLRAPAGKQKLCSEESRTFPGANLHFPRRKVRAPFLGVSGMMQTEHHIFDICLQIAYLQLGARPKNFNFERSEGQVIDLFFIKTCELHYLYVSLQRFCRIFKFIYPELA